jgi:hypothetical protein
MTQEHTRPQSRGWHSVSGRLAVALSAVAVVLAASGAGLAAAGGVDAGSNTINGCYNKTSGALTILTAAHKRCTKGTAAISWNKTGPRGPAGAAGPVYFSAGHFAASLGSPVVVASLSVPAGSYSYAVSVNVENDTGAADTFTCSLTDASDVLVDTAGATVPAGSLQAISLTGASATATGSATVTCQDTANSASAYVDSASFTATKVSGLSGQIAVLHTSSATGPAVSTADGLAGVLTFGPCAAGTATMSVSSNPPGPPATASLSATVNVDSQCQVAGQTANVTSGSQAYPLTIADTGGDAVTLAQGTSIQLHVSIPGLSLSCTLTLSGLTGHWSNATHGVTFASPSTSGCSSLADDGLLNSSFTLTSVQDVTAGQAPVYVP